LWDVDLDKVFRPVDIRERLAQGKIKAALIFGEDPLVSAAAAEALSAVEFKLVVDFFLTATASEADVVLPMSTPLENSGSYTACDRRVQRSAAILPPRAGMTNLEIIGKLSALTGAALRFSGADEIFAEIGQANPFYHGVQPGGFWGADLFRETFLTPGGKARFLPVSIAAGTCDGKGQPLLASENYVRFKIKSKLVV
jgi:formate dehydrogenase major subunit